MNYYQHNIGDYAVATLHLSFVEDAAYSRLLRRYYADEKPLPAELSAVQRLAGARSKEEREAVDVVLKEFFVLEADGWHQKRCDEEIAAFHDKADKARENGRRGGRPPSFGRAVPHGPKPSPEPEQTKAVIPKTRSVSETKADVTQAKANQEPLTINQDNPPLPPRKRGGGFDATSVLLPTWLSPPVWNRWVQHRREIRHPLTATTCEQQIADLGKWRDAGHDPESIINASLRSGWQGLFEPKPNTPSTHPRPLSLAERAAQDEATSRRLYGA